MNDFYRSFVESAKSIAEDNGLIWRPKHSPHGKVVKEHRWNLTSLRKMVPPPTLWMADLGFCHNAVDALNSIRMEQNLNSISLQAMHVEWQEFYLAVLVNELLVKKNKPQHALGNVGRNIRIIATCAADVHPWQIDSELVSLAYNTALRIGTSGKIAANLAMTVRTVFDQEHLADRSPLASFCNPYPGGISQAAHKGVLALKRSNNAHSSIEVVRRKIGERKSAEKLPERKAFWELVRIVFTEKPNSFSDVVRFAQIKLALVTGFRIGENALLPASWERWREYFDASGRPAIESGGISRSLMIRHFAEKQAADEGAGGVVLYENTQHVPIMFEKLILECLGQVEKVTRPMRERLRRITETGRLFPEFSHDELRPDWELYNRVTGSLHLADIPPSDRAVQSYRETYDPTILDEIYKQQATRIETHGVNVQIRKFWTSYRQQGLLEIRNSSGDSVWRSSLAKSFLRVGEVESLLRNHVSTKLPDTAPFTLEDGRNFYPYDLMFLMPIRALVDGRNGGVLDINRYLSVGRTSPADLQVLLGSNSGAVTLFQKYGKTDEDRSLKINTHALRHLQNAELFRLGVADAIITKRFNRRSVKQSYEYDHRSLLEELESINLPPEPVESLAPKALETYRLISSAKVDGPLVDEFRQIQRDRGDEAAFEFLNAEADGLHLTPYGFCVNSFTVDPCPKHLECFNGCRHLTRSAVKEEENSLALLRDRIQRSLNSIEQLPEEKRGIGWKNQLEHARTRLQNIELALATKPGKKPFPDGPDLFKSVDTHSGLSVLDIRGPKVE